MKECKSVYMYLCEWMYLCVWLQVELNFEKYLINFFQRYILYQFNNSNQYKVISSVLL